MDVKQSNDNNGFENALDNALNELENQGLGNINDETPVYILMAKNGKIIDNSFGVDVMIFTGGDMKEVLEHLEKI
jgi:hypothetical protein